jgi:hypothetical protein
MTGRLYIEKIEAKAFRTFIYNLIFPIQKWAIKC